MSTGLLPRTTVVDICGHRGQALRTMARAAALIEEGHALAEEAARQAERAHGNAVFTLREMRGSAYYNLFRSFDRTESLEAYRAYLDARIWMNLFTRMGMQNIMDREAKLKFEAELTASVPEVTPEAARQVFEAMVADSKLIFQRGIANAFGALDRRFKSHDGFKIGARVIISDLFDRDGYWNYRNRTKDTLIDIERVFGVLDGKQPEPSALVDTIDKARRGSWGARQTSIETDYYRVRVFKNGNVHLWFKRDDLVEKVNLQLADYYGEVLPDGYGKDEDPRDIKSKSGLPARNLSFYPTPSKVVHKLLRDVYPDERRILEPSAGTGHIVRRLLEEGGIVDAVEIDPGRVLDLELMAECYSKLRVIETNFLNMPANPVYDYVVMNPPFYGTHWMKHVLHAFDFLKPGGELVTVLPVTASIGESKKHKTFRQWAQDSLPYGNLYFEDLPAESFAESGTRVNTVILRLRKPR